MLPGHLGLLLSTLAGVTTTLGSLTVYCLKDFDPTIFALCMAVSAGVMIYVSFVELYPTSCEYFLKAFTSMNKSEPQNLAYVWFTVTFFIGWGISRILNGIMEYFFYKDTPSSIKKSDMTPAAIIEPLDLAAPKSFTVELNAEPVNTSRVSSNETQSTFEDPILKHKGFHTSEKEFQMSKHELIELSNTHLLSATSSNEVMPSKQGVSFDDGVLKRSYTYSFDKEPAGYRCMQPAVERKRQFFCCEALSKWTHRLYKCCYGNLSEEQEQQLQQARDMFEKDQRRIIKLGCFTAIVLALHNFPEGIATYTGSLVNPRFGVDIAVAFAIHNIPEGFSIAVPIYYGTGSKFKGFFYSFLSGMVEPAAAFLVHFITGGKVLDLHLGAIVGCVCGIMTCVALTELYPQALRYDVINRFTTVSLVLAMFIVAMTLVVLKLANM